MAGPIPKHPSVRQRTNRVSTAATLVDSQPLNGEIPPLPVRRGARGGKRPWRPEVVDWWNDIWQSPMAEEYLRSDLHGLFLLADLMDAYWRNPTTALATEIRLQRQCFGLTPIDRRRLQWEVAKGEEAERKRQPSTHERQHETSDPRDVLRVVS